MTSVPKKVVVKELLGPARHPGYIGPHSQGTGGRGCHHTKDRPRGGLVLGDVFVDLVLSPHTDRHQKTKPACRAGVTDALGVFFSFSLFFLKTNCVVTFGRSVTSVLFLRQLLCKTFILQAQFLRRQ